MFIEEYGKRLILSTASGYHPPKEDDIIFNIGLFQAASVKLKEVSLEANTLHRLELYRSSLGLNFSILWIQRLEPQVFMITFSEGGVNYQFNPVDGPDLLVVRADPNLTIFEAFCQGRHLNHIKKIIDMPDLKNVY